MKVDMLSNRPACFVAVADVRKKEKDGSQDPKLMTLLLIIGARAGVGVDVESGGVVVHVGRIRLPGRARVSCSSELASRRWRRA